MAERRPVRLRSTAPEPMRWRLARAVVAMIAAAAVVADLGWPESSAPASLMHTIEAAALLAYAGLFSISLLSSQQPWGVFLHARRFEASALALGVALLWWPPGLAVAALALLAHHAARVYLTIVQSPLPTGLIFIGSFLMLILLGAAALKLPNATPPEHPISSVDALFTSTSAVCVTGLIVRDTPTEFTRFGHAIILTLFQLGGLGIIFFGALLAVALGPAFGLRASRTLAETAAEGRPGPATIKRLILFITALTFVSEAIGAAMLYFGWPQTWPGAPPMTNPADRLFHSVFFAVSAFCNAGFATAPNSVEGLRLHWTTHTVMASLIALGGIGLPALENLRRVVWRKIRPNGQSGVGLVRLTLHTKLVLVTTLVVYLLGLVAVLIGRLAQGGESLGPALLDAHFMSLTSRTAGFDTVSPDQMGPLSRFSMMIFMFIGGSPGSTAGGVKTVVVAVIALTIWATMRGKDTTEVFGRTIPEDLVRKAATLITLGVAMIAVMTAALAGVEGAGKPLGDLLFEVVSASATVGLSTGITPDLSAPGRLILIVAMFFGRLGPLVVLAALVSVGARRRPHYEYPSEAVVMS